MFSLKSIVLIAAAFIISAEASAVAAPLVAPAHVGYAHAVPQNIPPYAAQINVQTRALNHLVAAPLAAPVASAIGPASFAAYAAAPYAAGPYFASPAYPAPFAAAPYSYPASGYAAPFPYATSPFYRAQFGVAPAFVR